MSSDTQRGATVATPRRLFALQERHHRDTFGAAAADADDGSFSLDNADGWGNSLCMERLRPFFAQLPRQQILTLGDGRGGREARFFRRLGHRVVATDISTEMLAAAHARGLIDEYARVDAEHIPFDDESFDYVFTKETLHHAQRPYQAVYEMLRVAREAAVLIEPHVVRTSSLGEWAKRMARAALGLDRRSLRGVLPKAAYEPCGNYLFRFDAHELTQCALALGLNHVAFGYAHHVWREGFHAIAGDALPRLVARESRRLWRRDVLRGSARRPLLIFAIFKRLLTANETAVLRSSEFFVPELAANPALKAG